MAKKTEFYDTICAKTDDNKVICLYCGKTVEKVVNPKGEEFYHCDCADAQMEHQLTEVINKLEKALPKTKLPYYSGWDGSKPSRFYKKVKCKNGKEKEQ